MDDLSPFSPENVVTIEPQIPRPDMSVLDAGKRKPPVFPLDMFNEDWQRWITEQAECISVPVDFIVYPLLSCAAALIGNSRRVYAGGNWYEPAAIWTGVVGNPSSRKSPAIDIAKVLLSEVEKDLAADYPETLRQWETDLASAKADEENWKAEVKEARQREVPAPLKPESAMEPEKPARPRVIVSDITTEALCKLLAVNPKGLLCWRDELSGWLQSFDSYRPGGDRPLWIEAFGGRSYTVDRVSRGEPLEIRNLTISLMGGIQPDKLSELLMKGSDDGLAARFLFAWPNPRRPRRPGVTPDNNPVVAAFRRLLNLDMARDAEGGKAPVNIPLTEGGKEVLYRWQGEAYDQDQHASGLFASHCGKFGGYVLRLAMVTTLMNWAIKSDGCDSPGKIGREAIGKACDFIEDYARTMAQRVYGDAVLPEAERRAERLAKEILRRKATTVNASDIKRSWRLVELKETRQVTEAVEVLVEAGWLLPAGTRKGATPGRRRSDYRVNSRVFEVDDA